MKTRLSIKKLLLFGISIISALGIAGNAGAALHVGNDPGNDNVSAVEAVVTAYNNLNDPDLPTGLSLFGKYDWDTDNWESGSGTITFSDYKESEPIAGAWSLPDAITYLSVKAGNGFALYYDPGASGDWNTYNLGRKGLSHLSFWITDTNPVPEPATMFLFGTGLVGLVAIGRKIKK
ncbi:MAG: PEP-CTERM sorting domain-containing protein [Thermodesulfobacteriota bacterium]|nr:PEP-CTERM sorting domain-containing protein [Thermodesulfobacteriota bacterium]